MTVYWIGCGLVSVGGHCHTMAHAMSAAAKRRGTPLVILVPRMIVARVTELLDVRPTLARSVYATTPDGLAEPASFEADVTGRRRELRGDLHRYLPDVTSSDTVVLVTPTAPELAAFADWCKHLAPERRPRLAAYCVLPVGYRLAPNAPWQRDAVERLYRRSLERLVASTAGQFRLFCENRQVLDDLSPFVRTAELRPHIFDRPQEVDACGRPGIPYVLVIGSVSRMRKDKGVELVLRALRNPTARNTPFDWIVQVAPMARARPAGFESDNIHFVVEVPNPREYWSYLSGASLVLLPYDPVAYGDGRGSGIFEEARAAGVPTLCSEAPFFVRQLSLLEEQGLVFAPYTAEALLQKTIKVMTGIEQYRERFLKRARPAGNGADALLDQLIGASGESARA